jgi:hypothetical protein
LTTSDGLGRQETDHRATNGMGLMISMLFGSTATKIGKLLLLYLGDYFHRSWPVCCGSHTTREAGGLLGRSHAPYAFHSLGLIRFSREAVGSGYLERIGEKRIICGAVMRRILHVFLIERFLRGVVQLFRRYVFPRSWRAKRFRKSHSKEFRSLQRRCCGQACVKKH